MNSLYNHGIKQTQLLTRDLGELESNISTLPPLLQGQIMTSLTAFRKTIREYNDLMTQNNFGDEKHHERLAKFQANLTQFQQKFDALRQKREALLHATNQLELMGRRHVSENSENPFLAQLGRAQMSYSEGLHKESQLLGRGHQQLDQILEMGQSAFDDLVGQNETLRRVGAKFEESLVTLGVSRGTILAVERRAKQDKWLFWASVLVLFALFYLIVRYFH